MKKTSIYLASDSTCQTYQKQDYPQAGWGQFLGLYLKGYNIYNHAIGGRSSKTFIEEGRLDEILVGIREKDYLFIQMGHNDSTKEKPTRYTEPYQEYKDFLRQYIEGARAKQAVPLLLTPVTRLHYVKGEFLQDFGDYCNAMKEVAAEEDVALIDLMKLSNAHLQSIGYQAAKTYFMVAHNGEDHTHFTEKGADQIAKIIALQFEALLDHPIL
ncbi:rhamnogalacturonan acetylesterase [Gracilibacillus thailandensis]|uniref:Rhamnogalacturonan acetylesterase n=1 Tax=Gracilibacillus thailandensis TaxID=563735 RepID=A0A6N7R339_9BACI|nr:rhamnogalacturonan acetylesterase [Gracilibacillus thailandensis]MRI66436.1 rhamnogalacturonan acetylesterase [Gracilibacillus thailandensis]